MDARTWLVTLGAVLSSSGCGGKAVVGGGPDDSLPPLPPPCDAAMNRVDGAACEDFPLWRRTTSILCAHEVVTKGCVQQASAYWSCLAAHSPTCVVADGGVPNSASAFIAEPSCDSQRDKMNDCLTACGASYSCVAEGWRACHCGLGQDSPGEACSAYPSEKESLPDCNVACSPCE